MSKMHTGEAQILTKPWEFAHDLEEQFSKWDAWWLSANIDIYNCDPKVSRDAIAIKEYLDSLIEFIDMVAVGDTHIEHFWDQETIPGYSMMQLIETSNVTAHFADLTDTWFMDIFSCKYYDPYKAAQFTQDFFRWEYTRILPSIRYNK